MSGTIFLIALAHTVPIFAVAALSKTQSTTKTTAVVIAIIAIFTGGAQYFLLDLIAIFVALTVCLNWLSPAPSGERAQAVHDSNIESGKPDSHTNEAPVGRLDTDSTSVNEELVADAELLKRGPYDRQEQIRYYRLEAEQGDGLSQAFLGNLYSEGAEVQQDYKEAMKWYRMSVEQGNPHGQISLADFLTRTRADPKVLPEIVQLYRLAAEQGDASGQIEYGNLFFSGRGVKQDYQEAAKWYRLAADQEDYIGQEKLGSMLFLGLGVQQDYEASLDWYEKAADGRNIKALIWLGSMYREGEGVPRDLSKAYLYFSIAAEEGVPEERRGEATQLRADVEKDMSSEVVLTAKRNASDRMYEEEFVAIGDNDTGYQFVQRKELSAEQLRNLPVPDSHPKLNEDDGSSPERAIAVDSIAEEYAWMLRNHPNFEMETQSLEEIDGKTYDVHTWRNERGEERTVYFDISEVY